MENKERIYTLTFFGDHTIDVIERNGKFYVGSYKNLTERESFYIVGTVTFDISKLEDWKSALTDLISSGINYRLNFNRKRNTISLAFCSKKIYIRDIVFNLVAFDYFNTFQDIINKYEKAVKKLKFGVKKQISRNIFNLLRVRMQSDNYVDIRMTINLDNPFEVLDHLEYAMNSIYTIREFSAQAYTAIQLKDCKAELFITELGHSPRYYRQLLICRDTSQFESLYTKRLVFSDEDTTFWELPLIVLKDKVKLPTVDQRFEVKFDGDLSKLTVLHVTPRDVLEKNPHIDDIITALT